MREKDSFSTRALDKIVGILFVVIYAAECISVHVIYTLCLFWCFLLGLIQSRFPYYLTWGSRNIKLRGLRKNFEFFIGVKYVHYLQVWYCWGNRIFGKDKWVKIDTKK